MPLEHLGHFMARPDHKWRSDDTIWTNGTTRHSSKQKKTIVGHILRLPTTRPASLALEWMQKMAGGGLEDQRGHGKTHWKKIWTYWVLTAPFPPFPPPSPSRGPHSCIWRAPPIQLWGPVFNIQEKITVNFHTQCAQCTRIHVRVSITCWNEKFKY